ncbi:response regulator [Paenibacillus mucilaginosus]|uniref:Response regulator receiver modulated diguanylate cyclase n=1 Tax=Paenibacillus mucilaginosus (strain KNP414) TaxID=1036673 RepID=F8FQV3_PAEMK|nr:response regulator [Paenibacillus mucilaginosus]AEI39283.1 response regulator receiver modulated diguanylate cyclase [Paenibacillus mucilaginosus KNP414]MCG7217009.1 response regulator [Paenibacillus mucilaginosus]WDM28283.1 response regulator [Paenibacillus mucilaginosus]
MQRSEEVMKGTGRQPTILVVDDERSNLEILRVFLSSLGYRVLLADYPLDAVRMVHHDRPDILLLDVMMPDVDGFALARVLGDFGIPILFISAKSQKEDILLGLSSGGLDYITKPFDLDILSHKIALHLESAQQMRALQRENDQLKQRMYMDPETGLFNRTYLEGVLGALNEKYNAVLTLQVGNLETHSEMEREEHSGFLKEIGGLCSAHIKKHQGILFRLSPAVCCAILRTSRQGCEELAVRVRAEISQYNESRLLAGLRPVEASVEAKLIPYASMRSFLLGGGSEANI